MKVSEGQKKQALMDDFLVPGITWVIFSGHVTLLTLGDISKVLAMKELSSVVTAFEPSWALTKAPQPVFQVSRTSEAVRTPRGAFCSPACMLIVPRSLASWQVELMGPQTWVQENAWLLACQ